MCTVVRMVQCREGRMAGEGPGKPSRGVHPVVQMMQSRTELGTKSFVTSVLTMTG